MLIPVGFYLTPEQKEAIVEAYINKTDVLVTVNHMNGPDELCLTKTQTKMLFKVGGMYDDFDRKKDLCEHVNLKLSKSQVQKQKYLKEIHVIRYKNDLHCN